jgi:hypothetical protein
MGFETTNRKLQAFGFQNLKRDSSTSDGNKGKSKRTEKTRYPNRFGEGESGAFES